jgi:hypothetical protein
MAATLTLKGSTTAFRNLHGGVPTKHCEGSRAQIESYYRWESASDTGLASGVQLLMTT